MLTSVALFEFFLIFFASSFTLVLVFSIFQTDYLKKRANAIVTGILVVNAIQGLIGAVHSIYWILYAHGFLPYNHSSKLFSTISSFFLLSASSAFDWFNIGIILKRITLLIFPLKKQLKIATTTVILFVVSVATIFGTVGFSIIYLVDPTNVLQDTIPQGCFSVGCGISHPPISKIFLVDFPIASTVIVITLGIFLLVLLKHNNIQLSKNIRMGNIIAKYIFIFHAVFLLFSSTRSAMDVAGDKRTPGRPKENPSTKAAEPSMSHESSENVPPKEEIDDSDPRGWVRGLLGENMKVYQSMHPVDFMEWNPRLLACALASKKGEVSIRRVQAGKVGWRVELSGETGLMWSDDSTLRQATTTLLAMCWSPDGDLLACSMNSGLVHYLDVESGRIKFTLRIEKPLHLIKWFRIEDLSALHFADYDHLALCKAPDFVVNKTDHREETQEMKDLESFVNETLPKALVGTVLVGARSPEDGAVVEAYAAGVMSIAQIKTDLSELRPRSIDIDPTTLEVQDVHVDPANHKPRRLWVSYRAIGVGKPSYDSEFGSITPDPHRKAYGYYTFVYGYDVRFGDFEYMSNVMGIAKRQTLLFHSVVLLQEMYAYMAKDWHLQSNIFQNRLKTEGNDNTLVNRPVVDYCSNLLDVILTGQMSTVVFQHLHEVSKEGIIKQMHKFLDERYGELIRILAGPLTTTGNTIHYQILQLLEEFVAFKDSDRLVNSFESIPDIASYPFELNLEAPEEIDFSTQRALRQAKEAAILLGRRIFEAKIVSFANRKDLKMLVRFLSICPPLFQAARTNQKESLFKSNDTYDTKTLINYIIATFGDYVDCDNEAIREKTPDPLEQILVKLKQIGTPPAESQENRPHENAIHARAVDPCLDRINDYFADKNDLPKELTLEPGWTPMWQEHHNIDMEEYDKLKDKNRSLKDAMMHMRKMFVELTKFVSEQLRSCDSNPEMIFVELCHPTGFTKIVLTSWEHASIPESISRKNPLRIDVDEERNRVQETAFGISQDVPRIVLIGKRETTEAKDGIIRTFAFAKDGTKIPMAHIGSPNPEVEMEDLRVGIKPWDNLMRKFIIDFQYFKEGILYGIVKFPENDTDHFIFKSSIFDRRGFVETEMTKARKIEKVAFSPDAQVGITIVPPFSRNTTSAKVLIFEGK